MISIVAPDGYEGCRYYDDGIREWRAAFRRIGETWWTNAYHSVGHAYLVPAELDNRAAAAIAHAIAIRTGTDGGRVT